MFFLSRVNDIGGLKLTDSSVVRRHFLLNFNVYMHQYFSTETCLSFRQRQDGLDLGNFGFRFIFIVFLFISNLHVSIQAQVKYHSIKGSTYNSGTL